MNGPGTPKMFSGATTASVVVILLLAVFVGGLAIAAMVHGRWRDVTLPAVGAGVLFVLALSQLRIMRNEKR